MTSRSSLLATTLLVLSSVILAGCGGGADRGNAEVKRFVSIGTAPAGGAFFPVGGAIAEVLDEFGGDEGPSVNAEATKGTQENIRRLVTGEIDLALANAAITYHAVRGAGGWDKRYEVRSVMTLAPNVALFIAPKSSGIDEVAELKGKRVVVGPAGAGFEYFLRPILQAHGVTYDDFTPLNNHQNGAVDMLKDGSTDAAFLGGAVPTASITQAATSMEIAFVPYEPAAVERLTTEFPFFRRATIKPDTYRGQDTPYDGLDVGSMHLITSADADERLIYTMTKILWEHRDAVAAKHPAGRAINEVNATRDTGTEFHSGAVRFYREIGIWRDDAAKD